MGETAFELGVAIKALDYFSGPLAKMMSAASVADGKMKSIQNSMKLMGSGAAEINAVSSALNKLNDRQAFAGMAQDLQKIGMAKSDIAAMEASYMRMAQYSRDMAAASATYAAGKDLVASGTHSLGVAAVGGFGIYELVKQAGEFQSNLATIQDTTGATNKQMQDFGNAIMNASSQVSKFNDFQMAQIAQTLTSGGFGNVKQAQGLLLPVAKFAEVQSYENKQSDPIESTKQAIEMAHLFKNYDPKSFQNFLDTFNKYSMMQPGDSTQLEQTLKYLAPTAQTMGMKADDILSLSAIANRVGLSGSHGGINAADMILRLIPGLIGGGPTPVKNSKGQITGYKTPKAWQAMEDLGFIDKNGKSKFFDKNGKVTNLDGMLSTMIDDSKKMNPMQLQQKYHDIFGIQGGRAAAILADPKTMEQLAQMRGQLSKTKGLDQIHSDHQNTAAGQLNLLKSNSMTLMLRVGQQLAVSLNPAIKSINSFLGKLLEFSQAHPGVAKIIGDFALLAVGGKATEGVIKILAGNVKMLKAGFDMLKIASKAGELTKFGSVVSKVGTVIKTAFAAFGIVGTGPILIAIAAIAAGAFLIYKNWGTIGPFVKKLWNDVKNYTVGVWNAIKPIVMGAVNSVWNTIKSAWGGIVSFCKSIWPQVQQIVQTVWPIISSIITMDMKNIWIVIQTVGTIIVAYFRAMWTMIVPIVQTAWTLIKDYIKTAWDFISGLIKIGLDLVTGNWKKAWEDLKTMTSSLWKDVQKIFTDGWNGIKKIASGWKDAATQWGKDIVNGLSNGIKSMWGNVTGTVKSLGSTISSSFKSMLGINSPSKVFAEHGKWIVAGLSQGIDGNAHTVQQSTTRLANGVTNSFRPNTTGLHVNSNTNNGGITIMPGAIVIQGGNASPEQIANMVLDKLGKASRRSNLNAGISVNMGAI